MALFQTSDAPTVLRDWHRRFRERLPFPTESREIGTPLGATHLLSAGAPDAPPVVLLHGAMASSAHVLLEVAPLVARFRVHALDVVGQSPMSADTRPDPDGPEYGRWLVGCLDALALPRARVVAVSWGAAVALRTAALAPERFERLSLIVPAGLVQGPAWAGMVRLGWPMGRYRLFPTPANRDRFLAALLTDRDPLWEAYLGDAFRLYRLDFHPPRRVRDGELSALTAPVQVVAAERDLSFPGAALLARARRVFPNLASEVLLSGARHSPSFADAARRDLSATIAGFFDAAG